MKKAYLLVFILILVLFTKMACADQMSFGSVGHNQRITMIPGETKEFRLSFFNYGDNPLVVEVKKTGSNEIRSYITPKYFVLEDWKNVINPMGEEEWVMFGNNYVRSVPVHVTLKVPDNISEISRNYHVVKIVAKATTEGGGSSGTREKITQAREYTYAITVPGRINASSWEEYEETLEEYYQELQSNKSEDSSSWNIGVRDSEKEMTEEQRGNLPTGFFSLGGDEDSSSFYYIIIAIVIVFLVYFVYRRFRR